MKKEIREKRKELYIKSIKLRSLAGDINGKRSYQLRDQQDDVFKRWQFYNGIIKASDKIKDKD